MSELTPQEAIAILQNQEIERQRIQDEYLEAEYRHYQSPEEKELLELREQNEELISILQDYAEIEYWQNYWDTAPYVPIKPNSTRTYRITLIEDEQKEETDE